MERWAHLLEEIKERGIDMRRFSAEAQDIGDRIRAGEIPRAGMAEIQAAGTKPAAMEAGKYYTNSLGKISAAYAWRATAPGCSRSINSWERRWK